MFAHRRRVVLSVLAFQTLTGLGDPVAPTAAPPAVTAPSAGGVTKKTDELAQSRLKYTEALRRADEKRDQGLADLNRTFERLLATRESECMAKGDLDATLAVRAERARFAKEKSVPAAAEGGIHAEVASLRTRYDKSLRDLVLQRHRETLQVTDAYTNQLVNLRASLTRQGRLDEAKAVNIELDFVLTDQTVRTAREAVTKTEPASSTPVRKPPPTAPERVKVARTLKVVDPRGTLSDTWTSVPINLKEGDVVTVEASGTWTAPDVSASCGPAGHVYTGPYAGAMFYPRYSYVQRPLMDLPYAALILRVGRAGKVRAVGERLCFTNDTPGMLAFDMNAKQDRKHRTACTGSMKVTVEVQR
jgi:hypothetical protein